ncbi:HAD family phosphatase [Streptomyces roseirectus]|uniref:HAD family phosphatase n=1 Tax=Streptomyces roseirectus TaxID=2768066 RepID=A0A7H0I7U7_9ACTN|nr:HAD-IB family phosphatase [Streptomyces roseirectus]QNP68863.1 HAD family phosphatase [Streptomyces roseirectus]
MQIPVAVLDMDGTLHPGFLARTMVRELRTLPGADHAAANAALEHLRRYAAREISHEACARGFYAAYARALYGLRAPLLREAGVRAWQRERAALFPHARPLVAALRAHGLVTCLISGSPVEVIAPAATDLGVDRFWGAVPELCAGAATGRLLRGPALPGGKGAVLTELGREMTVDWAASLAVGDSSSDVETLEQVGLPLAFEPDPVLHRVARSRGWPVENRDTLLNAVHRLLDGPRPCVPRRDPQVTQRSRARTTES